MGITCGPANVEVHITTINPAQFLKPLHKCRKASLPFRIILGEVHENANSTRSRTLLRARPGLLPTIAGHRPSYDAKSPFRLSTETVDYAPVAPTTYRRAIRSGSTFSPPAICGCDGTKPLRASRCPTSARANANASLSRVVRRSATLKKASPK